MAGWGYGEADILAAVLTEVKLPVISNLICRRDTTVFTGDFSATRTLTSNMFCAGHSANTSLDGTQCHKGCEHIFPPLLSIFAPLPFSGTMSLTVSGGPSFKYNFKISRVMSTYSSDEILC